MPAASDIAYTAFKKICDDLPYNTNKVYGEVFLENSRCLVYMPIRKNLVENSKATKKFFEELANAAKL